MIANWMEVMKCVAVVIEKWEAFDRSALGENPQPITKRDGGRGRRPTRQQEVDARAMDKGKGKGKEVRCGRMPQVRWVRERCVSKKGGVG